MTTRVSELVEERGKKSFTDLVVERSFDLLGCTPDEKSDENLKWMRENGYLLKQTQKRRRGARGRFSESERPK